MTKTYYHPLRRQVGDLDQRYHPELKPMTFFHWFDENGEVFELFGPGFSWSKSRDGGDPPEITDELVDSIRAGMA